MVRRLVVLSTLVLVLGPLLAQEKRGGDSPAVSGKMLAHDREKKTLTIGPATGKPVTLQMDRATVVLIDGRRGEVSAIPDNHPVQVLLGADGKMVRQVAANGPTQQRRLIAVHEARRTLQLEREKGNEEVPVALDATIVVNGKDAKITDLQPGDTPSLRFAIDGKTILGIQVGLPKPEKGKIPLKNPTPGSDR